MGLVTESLCVEILAIFIAFMLGIVTYIKWSFTYWETKNLPYLKPVFPYGTMENPLSRTTSLGFWLKSNYNELKSQGHKHGGLYNFTSPLYLPIDPEYVKNIMQKDFNHFTDRAIYYNEKDDPLSAHVFALGGDKWRSLRTKLTPSFTSGKIRMMFETLVRCSYPMKNAMDDYSTNNEPVDIKEIVARFTTDIIGSCAFGLECNSFKSPDADFRKYGRKIFKFSKIQFAKLVFLFSKPEIGRLFGMTITPKDSADFFMKVVKDTITYREANSVVRKDMLQLLMELMHNKHADNSTNNDDDDTLSVEEIAAQVYVFFLAGFETSSTTMTFCLFELAINPDIQEKVREEVNNVLAANDGKITYEAMIDMKYMGQVIEETLRKYPPVTQISRACVKDYPIPNTDVVIEKGTKVFISPLGLHRDPEYYPQPEKFDPERFSEENRNNIIPFTYLPFGEGPRICIGLRFGILQIKVGLTVLLQHYKFSLNSRTEVPLKIDPFGLAYTTKGTIWLNTEKI